MFEKKKRISDQEIGLIKSTFKDQEQLLISLRKFLLQGDMTPDEVSYLRTVFSKEVIRVVRKVLCPSLDKGAVIGGTVDLFSGMDLTATPIEHANLGIKARKLAVDYLNQQFNELEGNEAKEPIMFDNLISVEGTPEQNYINFIARNFLLGHLDGPGGIIQFLILSMEGETKEEAVERMKKNSSK